MKKQKKNEIKKITEELFLSFLVHITALDQHQMLLEASL